MNSAKAILVCFLFALCLAGCKTPDQADDEPRSIVQINRSADGTNAPPYKTIKDGRLADEIFRIVHPSDESLSLASMSRGPDYKLTILNADPTASSEPIGYELWHSAGNDFVEVVSGQGGGYLKLSPEDSSKLLTAIQGN